MEAMAVGTAVVLCDFAGVGPMVRSSDLDRLRPLNFGFEALAEPLGPEPLLREMARYDPIDAARVRDRLRACASLEGAVERIAGVYREVIEEQREEGPAAPPDGEEPGGGHVSPLRDALAVRGLLAWLSMPQSYRDSLSRMSGIRRLKRRIGGLVLGRRIGPGGGPS